jgi:hypothetical protein
MASLNLIDVGSRTMAEKKPKKRVIKAEDMPKRLNKEVRDGSKNKKKHSPSAIRKAMYGKE